MSIGDGKKLMSIEQMKFLLQKPDNCSELKAGFEKYSKDLSPASPLTLN